MKVEILGQLTSILPRGPGLGMTAATIRDRFFERFEPDTTAKAESKMKRINRYLESLLKEDLVQLVPGSVPCRYYLNESKVRDRLTSPDARLSLFWSRQTLSPLLPMLRTDAQALLNVGSQLDPIEQLLWQRVRIVPDGIGRQNADIKREHLLTVAEALRKGLMLEILYGKQSQAPRRYQISVLGLAVKDGTIYMLAAESMGTQPRHLPLHRVRSLTLLRRPADRRPDFDIDRYIAEQYQLSHKIESAAPPEKLELLVHKEALFHFDERPLIDQDPIDKSDVVDGDWYRVTALVPDTIHLVPFILSHGGWVKVMAPKSVKDKVIERLRAGASLYPD